ncbi:Photosystem II 10 kDa polypeptide [Forsythia ovata]|uniref:Photosystem II 10 kDa polypeptide, chloroplastic n=1 Tax=Forsythia ovata TaxID=205694 RepID=A0ABD1QAD8_9LAMI
MATTVMSSLSLKPSPFTFEKVAVRGLPSLARTSSFKVEASGGKKIKTDKPYGINGGMALREGSDASGRKAKGKGVYQFVDKYGANVDGYRGFPATTSLQYAHHGGWKSSLYRCELAIWAHWLEVSQPDVN